MFPVHSIYINLKMKQVKIQKSISKWRLNLKPYIKQLQKLKKKDQMVKDPGKKIRVCDKGNTSWLKSQYLCRI